MSEIASSEPRIAEEETQVATNPEATEASTEEKPATYTDMSSNAATTAATSATTAAAGVKDSVFSMFGGGAKKETKVEDTDAANDRSGSSKAQKEREDEEVGYNCSSSRPWSVYLMLWEIH
jgi:Ran-binding protein 1